MRKLLFVIVLIIVIATGVMVWQKQNSQPSPQQANQSSFNKNRLSTDDPASIWVVVNKQQPLHPLDYEPSDLVVPSVPLRINGKGQDAEMRLRMEPAQALASMIAAAKNEGLTLMVASAYRSHSFQQDLYNGYVRQQGQAAADTQSARPGYSEHQTGLAVDLEPASRECEIETCFAGTPEGKWLAEHAYEFGFILRYPEGKQELTGYIYEPWHFRYVGKALAAEVYAKGNPTLEQFFGLAAAADYK